MSCVDWLSEHGFSLYSSDVKELQYSSQPFTSPPPKTSAVPLPEYDSLVPPSFDESELITSDNIGHYMLERMGWSGGGVGKHGTGAVEPVSETLMQQSLQSSSKGLIFLL